jgi:hypothetical protein
MRPWLRAVHLIAKRVGQKATSRWCVLFRFCTALLSIIAVVCSTTISSADEGGVAFWLPGLYGSLSAAPLVPGWAIGIVDIYTSVTASGNRHEVVKPRCPLYPQ